MTLVGVWINGLAIVAAGLLGSRCKQGLPERIKERLMAALALCLLYIGIGGINADMNLMVLTISVTAGALIGEWLEIEYRMGEACRWLQRMGRRLFGQQETGDDTDHEIDRGPFLVYLFQSHCSLFYVRVYIGATRTPVVD